MSFQIRTPLSRGLPTVGPLSALMTAGGAVTPHDANGDWTPVWYIQNC